MKKVIGICVALMVVGLIASAEEAAQQEKTLTGVISSKPDGAGEEVLAVLVLKEGKKYNLLAEKDEVISAIEELAGKNVEVVVTGIVDDDAGNITVSSIKEAKKEGKKERKGGKKKGEEAQGNVEM